MYVITNDPIDPMNHDSIGDHAYLVLHPGFGMWSVESKRFYRNFDFHARLAPLQISFQSTFSLLYIKPAYAFALTSSLVDVIQLTLGAEADSP
jgi:hypothetical protein